MRIKPLILFLLPSLAAFCQQKRDWEMPGYLMFTTFQGDTSYYNMTDSNGIERDKARIDRILKGDSLFEFYFKGNLESVCLVKEIQPEVGYDVNKKEHTIRQFVREGACKIYFNDSTRTLAALGYYKNDKPQDNWLYYDKQKRLIGKSYAMPLWTRSDYYDTTGGLAKQTDRIETIEGKIYTVKEVEFINGTVKVVSNKTLFTKIYLRFLLVFFIVILGSFFIRIPFNHIIYNREENKSNAFLWFPGSDAKYGDAMFHGIRVMYTFWWSNVKPENKKLALVANILSVTSLVLFFGTLILLGISGELY